MTIRLSPSFLAILYHNGSITIEQFRHFGKLANELTLYAETNTSATQENEHCFIKGVGMIYVKV